ncbi:MAG: hypothetical protein AAFX65_06075 [Cyanobacteria bacterium J06638_7]
MADPASPDPASPDPAPPEPMPPQAKPGWWANTRGWLRQYLPQLPTLVVALATLLGVSTLSTRMSTSEMLLAQIDNLKEEDSLPRNMSILAIEHTLASRSPVEGVHHDLLLTHVLGEVLMHDKARGDLLGEDSEAGIQRRGQIQRILLASIRDLNPRCAHGFTNLGDASGSKHEGQAGLQFNSSSSGTHGATPRQPLSEVVSSPACRHAAALGVWTGWWPGKASRDEVLRTSVQRLAEITPEVSGDSQLPLSSQITTSPIESRAGAASAGASGIDLERLSQEQIRSASEIVAGAVALDQQKRMVSERHGKLPGLPHVFIHYDDKAVVNGPLRAVAEGLSQSGEYFVDRTLRHVPPTARACAPSSQVKFFHQADRELAEDLVAAANAVHDLPPDGWTIEARSGLIDLSNWSLAAKVPRGQLELWLISNGSSCRPSTGAEVSRASGE